MTYTFNYEHYGELPDYQEVVLMSGSPRRRELLEVVKPRVQTLDIDELSIESLYFEKYKKDSFLERVAKTCCEIAKAKSDVECESQVLYISADTVVVHDNRICHKPVDLKDAERMFRSYFGKVHAVVTAVAVRAKDYLDVFYTVAYVKFVDYASYLEEAIDLYMASGSPMDKSGSYGIQEIDPMFVEWIEGDVHTIVGLPVAEVIKRIYKKE